MPITSFILCSTSTTVRARASSRMSTIVSSVSSGSCPRSLVQQEQHRIGGEHDADLEMTLLPVGEVRGELSARRERLTVARISTARSWHAVSASARDQKLNDAA